MKTPSVKIAICISLSAWLLAAPVIAAQAAKTVESPSLNSPISSRSSQTNSSMIAEAPEKVIVDAEFSEKLAFLFRPHRFKVLYGGRNGLKSWGIARYLLTAAFDRKLRILCARETMKSIADSVHKLLSDQITAMKLGAHFQIQKASILGINGSEFAFVGLRNNINQVKSYEGFDKVWIEEANDVSHASWKVLIPTIRKEGSEILVSFNPELDTDDTYKRFVLSPPPGAMVVKTSWRDNPWLSPETLADIRHMRATDEAEFNNVYEGLCVTSVAGAIYAKELAQSELEQRITRVPYDATKPVYTFWDLGFGDNTAIWFVQAFPFEYRLIDFLQGSGQKLGYYQKQLQDRDYVYGAHYLPHDAQAKTLAADGKSIEQRMRGAVPVKIVPNLSVTDGIDAVRTIFPQCWFDAEKCADGIQALKHYRWAPNASMGVDQYGRPHVSREPLHNWASHPSDAIRYFAVGIKPPKRKEPERPRPAIRGSAWS